MTNDGNPRRDPRGNPRRDPRGNPRRDPLERLARVNPTVVVLAVVALFLVILFLPAVPGAVLILAIAAGLAYLLTRTWPVLPPQQRVLRLVVIGLLVLVAASRIFS